MHREEDEADCEGADYHRAVHRARVLIAEALLRRLRQAEHADADEHPERKDEGLRYRVVRAGRRQKLRVDSVKRLHDVADAAASRDDREEYRKRGDEHHHALDGVGEDDGAEAAKTYNLAVSAGWELDLFGKLTNAKRGARAALEGSRAYSQAVQTQLVATIANSYYNLLMLDCQVDISRRTVDSWKEIVRTYEAKMRVGEATEAAVAQAKASMLSVEASLLTLEKQVKQQEYSLSLLLGSVPRSIERSSLDEQHFPDNLAVGVPLQLLGKRPDVRQAEYSLAQAFYATNAARAAFYPSITLSGSAGWTNNSGTAIVNPGNWLLSAISSLTQPLFNRGQNIANLRIAKAQQEEALLSFKQSLLKAGSEVNDALVQWQAADARLVVVGEQVETLQSAVEHTRKLMEYSSRSSYLEVLTAQQSLLQAELTEANDRFDKIQGVINLYHALGGGAE